MKNVMKELVDEARDDNIIIIEISGTNNRELSLFDFTVSSRMNIPHKPAEFVNIKPKVITGNQGDSELLYFYIVYDLCQINAETEIELKIKSTKGTFTGNMKGSLKPVDTFKVICVDKESDWFKPRELHGACTSYDQKLWVFGGRNYVGFKSQDLNDLYYYDEILNKWHEI